MLNPVTCNRKLPNDRRIFSASSHFAACAVSSLAWSMAITREWLATAILPKRVCD